MIYARGIRLVERLASLGCSSGFPLCVMTSSTVGSGRESPSPILWSGHPPPPPHTSGRRSIIMLSTPWGKFKFISLRPTGMPLETYSPVERTGNERVMPLYLSIHMCASSYLSATRPWTRPYLKISPPIFPRLNTHSRPL